MTGTLTDGGLYRLLAWLSPGFPVGAFSYSHGIEAAVEAGSVRDRETLTAWIAAILSDGAGRVDADLFRDAWGVACSLAKTPSPLRGEGWGEGEPQRERGFIAPPDHPLTLPSRHDGPLPLPAGERDKGDALVPLLAIAARAEAYRGTAETALEARAQGEAFLATCRAAWPHPLLNAVATTLAAERRAASYPVVVAVAAAAAGVPLAPALTAYLHAVAANLVSAGLRLVPLGQTDGQRALQALAAVVASCIAASLARSAADFGSCALAAELASISHEEQYTRLFRS